MSAGTYMEQGAKIKDVAEEEEEGIEERGHSETLGA